MNLSNASVALVHDWLVTWRGGEKVLATMAALFPHAPIYTLLYEPGSMPPQLEQRRIVTSWVDRFPSLRSRHRFLLPLYPSAIASLRLPADVDLVISSSHCAAKAVPIPAGAKHLSYIHAPLRYMWDRFDDYFGAGRTNRVVRLAAMAMRPALQRWDIATANNVDAFVANSQHVARQIAQRYRRAAQVIPPPVELSRFTEVSLAGGQGGYFLCFGALAPYKRIDLAIEATARLGVPLWVAGGGQAHHAWLRNAPKHVKVLGEVSDAKVPALMQGARALLFPGVEDFGITPLEMLACGRPVVAFAAGGALETLSDEVALFFEQQTSQSLADALRRFDAFEKGFSPQAARSRALAFSATAFSSQLLAAAQRLL
jgi:glycosyltransferase involved in cell wall biosynthesis